MKKIIFLTISVLLVFSIILSGCGSASNAQKFFRYDMEKYIALPSYETVIDSQSDSFKSYYDEILYKYLAYKVEDGSVMDRDVVNIDFTGYYNGVAFDGGTSQGYNLKIGSGSFIDDFEEQLIGAMPGEKIDVNVTFPEAYSNEELAGKDATFKVTVNYITRMGELNDENAQKANFKDALELADLADRDAIISCAWDELLGEIKILKYPKKEMSKQLKYTLDAYYGALEAESLTFEDYAKKNNMSVEELKKAIEEDEVSGIISTYLVYYGILQKADYQLTDDDVNAAKEYIKAQSENNNFEFSAYSDMYIEGYAAYTAASEILFKNAKVK